MTVVWHESLEFLVPMFVTEEMTKVALIVS
jgi:hypothetical protein